MLSMDRRKTGLGADFARRSCESGFHGLPLSACEGRVAAD